MILPSKEEQIRSTADMYVHHLHNAIERLQRDGDDFIRKAVMCGASRASIWIRFTPDEIMTIDFDVEYPTALGTKEEEAQT